MLNFLQNVDTTALQFDIEDFHKTRFLVDFRLQLPPKVQEPGWIPRYRSASNVASFADPVISVLPVFRDRAAAAKLSGNRITQRTTIQSIPITAINVSKAINPTHKSFAPMASTGNVIELARS
jgi:hypothetical protein